MAKVGTNGQSVIAKISRGRAYKDRKEALVFLIKTKNLLISNYGLLGFDNGVTDTLSDIKSILDDVEGHKSDSKDWYFQSDFDKKIESIYPEYKKLNSEHKITLAK